MYNEKVFVYLKYASLVDTCTILSLFNNMQETAKQNFLNSKPSTCLACQDSE